MSFMQFVPREVLALGVNGALAEPFLDRGLCLLRRGYDRRDRYGYAAVVRQGNRIVELKLTVDDGGSVCAHDSFLAPPCWDH
jgi:hypothetical protein